MNKKLVCYFSATGTTRKAAEKLSQILQCDLFEIEPKEKYTDDDLDWTNNQSRTTKEMSDKNSRPRIKEKIKNIENYNEIILGFPVWWYKEPSIINTFIEENNLENKNVYIFVTSGGSTATESLEDLKKKYNKINFISGKRINSNISENEVLEWIK